jgi:hypothetical protein
LDKAYFPLDIHSEWSNFNSSSPPYCIYPIFSGDDYGSSDLLLPVHSFVTLNFIHMRLRIKLHYLGMLVLTAMLFTMCSSDEGLRPSDDAAITGRGLISGGTGTTVNLIGLSTKNELVFLTVLHGATETGLVPIVGLRDGENIVAIDKTKDLFGLSDQSTIYKIDLVSGIARPLGGSFIPALSGDLFGFDVSPSDNVIRVMTSDQNLRISSSTGQVIGQDPLFHISPITINSIAYVPGVYGGKTILYAIDIAGQKVYKQAPAGYGSVALVGSTGFDWRLEGGFDIASNGVGYTVQYGHGVNGSGSGAGGGSDDTSLDDYRLHSINLKSGAATSLGVVRPMIGLTVR